MSKTPNGLPCLNAVAFLCNINCLSVQVLHIVPLSILTPSYLANNPGIGNNALSDSIFLVYFAICAHTRVVNVGTSCKMYQRNFVPTPHPGTLETGTLVLAKQALFITKKEKKDRSLPCGTNKSTLISGLKFISMNINSIRGKKLELLAFLDFNQPHIVAIQETKIDSSIATSELFPETCPYSVYRKDRNIHGGGVMLLVHKDISHIPITELENDSESIWVKVFVNKTSHFVAIWYRSPGSTSEEFQLFREQLDYTRTHHKGKKLPSVHVLGDFNFKDIDWPDRLSESGSTLSQSEGQILIDIMNDHGLEQMVHFPTREKSILDLILTTLPGQFQDVHSPDKLSDHDIFSGTLKIFIPQ